ncbi:MULTISPECIES: DUF2000 domain-containing protein [Aeromicrobium]|uniref:DUF2000 domain-containing protein n=1 Tax=Aeromicrobium TaxID=2040 RepID=UPI0006FDBD67|nr:MULTISPECIES: DUF2000 domain-containing protein [Aeromicrobium]KQX74893.1 hypothetical protein ASD10_06685 [Aeromicrobium sp. Root472D3]MCL8253239.1 DUF2000 domain-containing protein [Aeromicrobium fastidiosum]
MDTPEPIRFDTKVAVLLRDDLEQWQALNVTAFLVSGVAAHVPDLIGDPYEDADGIGYLAMIRQPVVVFEGDAERLTSVHAKAVSRGLATSVYTREMFATGNDRDNRAAVRAVATADLDLVGIAVHGPRNAVDKTFKGAALHR